MKKLSFIPLYRSEFMRLTENLEDRELVLYLSLVTNAGWDRRHINTYGKVNKTLREIREEFFPSWSLGKVHSVVTSLKNKGFVQISGKRSLGINYFWIYTATRKEVLTILSNPEHNVQLPKQIVHRSEQNVRSSEQIQLRKEISDLVKTKRFPRSP